MASAWSCLLLAAACRSSGGGASPQPDASDAATAPADVLAFDRPTLEITWPDVGPPDDAAIPTPVLGCEDVPSPPTGECRDKMLGLVCPYAGDGGLVPCTCRAGWNCGADSACPATPPRSGDNCGTTPYVTNIAACRYRESGIKCSCIYTTSWLFFCNRWECPDRVPVGTCTALDRAAGTCRYALGGDCTCATVADGSGRWMCDGKFTPDCPAQRPQGGNCSDFPVGAACRYPGSACVCYPGTPPTWQCGGGP